MDNQPNSNPNAPEEETRLQRISPGRDYISVSGNRFGSNNIVNIGGDQKDSNHKYAGHSLFADGKPITPEAREFSSGMIKLRKLIVEAYKAGEIPEKVARKAAKTLKDTVEIVTKEQKPDKPTILRRLEFVADLLETAADMVGKDTLEFLGKAVPLIGMLIKLASRIF